MNYAFSDFRGSELIISSMKQTINPGWNFSLGFSPLYVCGLALTAIYDYSCKLQWSFFKFNTLTIIYKLITSY